MTRSLLYVPATSERFIAKAHERGADAIILDLEDSIVATEKDAARQAIADAVPRVGAAGAKVLVRINAEDDLQLADALAALRAGADALMVPKVRSAETLACLVTALERVEARDGLLPIALVAVIEHPEAVLNAAAIAAAPRLIGLCTGGEDLALALGAQPTPAVLHLPKLLVHYAAKARGLMSFGLLRSVADYADLAGIAQAAREAREHGFDGATCVHPSVVPILNEAFSPSVAQLDWAKQVVSAAADGKGAFQLNGQMIDAPVIARAKALLAQTGGGAPPPAER